MEKSMQYQARMLSSRMRTARASGGVPARDVPAWGVYLLGGTCPGGVYLPGKLNTAGGCTCPGTPPCEQNDRQVKKYYLAPNFVLGAVNMSMRVRKGLRHCSYRQGSHFSGLTKFPDFSSIFFNFPVFFNVLFFKLKTLSILANNTQFI